MDVALAAAGGMVTCGMMSKLKDEGWTGMSEAIGTVYYSAPILTVTLGLLSWNMAGPRVNFYGVAAGAAAAGTMGVIFEYTYNRNVHNDGTKWAIATGVGFVGGVTTFLGQTMG